MYASGFVFKKNSTGLFRNWKRVQLTLTRTCLRWKSLRGDIQSKYYKLTGATVTKSSVGGTDFRFSIANMVEEGAPKGVQAVTREFASESLRYTYDLTSYYCLSLAIVTPTLPPIFTVLLRFLSSISIPLGT